MPVPVEVGGVDLFAGACGEVGFERDGGAVERALAGLDLYLPASFRIARTINSCAD